MAVGDVVKVYENGYKVVEGTPGVDGATQVVTANFSLVNPEGRILLHADKPTDFDFIVNNPVRLTKVETTGSI